MRGGRMKIASIPSLLGVAVPPPPSVQHPARRPVPRVSAPANIGDLRVALDAPPITPTDQPRELNTKEEEMMNCVITPGSRLAADFVVTPPGTGPQPPGLKREDSDEVGIHKRLYPKTQEDCTTPTIAVNESFLPNNVAFRPVTPQNPSTNSTSTSV